MRLALALTLLAVGVAVFVARRGLDERRAWAEARERLAAGDARAAVERFGVLAGAHDEGSSAQLGLRIARALTGEVDDAPLDGRALASVGLSLPGLFEQALGARRLEAATALARLMAASGEPAAALYEAVAAVERGDDAAARRHLGAAPPELAESALGAALGEVLDWRARGAARLLRDRRGRLLGALDAQGRFTPRDGQAAACLPAGILDALAGVAPGAGARLTLDLDLCALARDALGPARGTIVLLDVRTGGLLAAVSDERTRAREPGAAFTQLREPASTAKLITTTAALRAGVDPDEFLRLRSCHGSQRYGAGTLWCPARAREFGGLARPLAISCNVAFADLAASLGRAALLDEYRRYGFTFAHAEPALPGQPEARAAGGGAEGGDEAEAQELDDEATVDPARDAAEGARVLAPQGDERQLADLAVGLQDVAVTPLYGARFAAVFATGRLPRPRFVEALDGALGRTPRRLSIAPPQEVLASDWLARLWPAMQAVAEWGTAAGVAPSDFPVAMKTGTASQFRVGYHCQHFGVGPLPRPWLAFAVRVTHQRTSPRAGAVAREVTGRLLTNVARLAPGS